MRPTSSVGSPTAVSTINMVTKPASGTPAAPMAAAVEVMLQQEVNGLSYLVRDIDILQIVTVSDIFRLYI